MSESAVLNLGIRGGVIFITIAVTWWILQIAANWLIFTKAGQAGWKSIIPVVSGHTAYKIVWKPGVFWLVLAASFVVSGIQYNSTQVAEKTGIIMLAVLFVLSVVLLIIEIIYCYKLAVAFGKGIGFTIGLILLHPVFILILGLGSAEYHKRNA